jgi:hypothetical protein
MHQHVDAFGGRPAEDCAFFASSKTRPRRLNGRNDSASALFSRISARVEKIAKLQEYARFFSKLVPRHVAPKQRLIPPRHHVLPLWHLNIRDVARNVQSPRANAVRGSLSLYTGCISDHFQPAATLAINMPTEENAAKPSL